MGATNEFDDKTGANPAYQVGDWKETTSSLIDDAHRTSHIGMDQAGLPPVQGLIKTERGDIAVQETGGINQAALKQLQEQIEANPELASQMRTHYGLLGEIFAPQEKIDYLKKLIVDFDGERKCSSLDFRSGEYTFQFLRTLSNHISDIKTTCNNNPNILLLIKTKLEKDSDIASNLIVIEMLSSKFDHYNFEKTIEKFQQISGASTMSAIWGGTKDSFFELIPYKTNKKDYNDDSTLNNCATIAMNLARRIMSETIRGDLVELAL